ncbi:uncharacterized protein EV422DRAFT_565558 [Fimicolochytrium jonesii]|uniref:uncharacterized protein n=1 Tax=Fimicolochytrium jonesii TaxID=1396493 RepID=UPI0022FF115B|nr:uncharacterized protein EV422DRAFT_565558 [Fimicolochytrium jonesii]KAI8823622.1 hypothetical protein EV422DRAFT_565558 [Fimicolochytrium jonesii]
MSSPPGSSPPPPYHSPELAAPLVAAEALTYRDVAAHVKPITATATRSHKGHAHDHAEDHICKFWESEEHLLNIVVGFVAPNLAARNAVIVVARARRTKAIEEQLRHRDIDVGKLKERGSFILLNAEDVLSVLQLPNGDLCPRKYDEVVGNLVRSVESQYPGRVYIYGEMVDLLWEWNRFDMVLAIEAMWNELRRKHRFTLLCGYCLDYFRDPTKRAYFVEVCNLHSKVAPIVDIVKHLPQTQERVAVDDVLRNFSSTAPAGYDVKGIETKLQLLQHTVTALQKENEQRKAAEFALHSSLNVMSHQAQSALGRERNESQLLLSILPVGVYGTAFGDAADYYVNKRFCELVDRTPIEIRLSGWLDAIHPEDRERLSGIWPFNTASIGTATLGRADVPMGNGGDNQAVPELGSRIEYRFVLRDGTIRWVTGETVNNRDSEGNVRGHVHTILDITDLRTAERHRAQEAEEHQRQQEDWIDSLCHELRNPLNGISGNVELMESSLAERRKVLAKPSLTDDDIQLLQAQLVDDEDSLDAIGKCVAHQKIITDDVLNVSKLDLGKIKLDQVEMDLKESLHNVCKMFEVQASSKGLDLRVNFPIGDVRCIGDPKRVSQVVVNLLANAVKFTDDGSITVSVSILARTRSTIEFCVSVADTGRGLSPEERTALFQRFHQPTSQQYHQFGGSGLGLYLSKGLAELMGGALTVTSEKGLGSDFRFTFVASAISPRSGTPTETRSSQASIGTSSDVSSNDSSERLSARDNLLQIPRASCSSRVYQRRVSDSGFVAKPVTARCAETVQPALSDARSPAQKMIKTVLVVEDNVLNQKIMIRFLETAKYKVLIANNGLEALSLYREADLIFMDIIMPEMDGLTATKEIRKLEAHPNNRSPDVSSSSQEHHIPIIGLSGNAREDHVEAGLNSGMDQYVTKPVTKAKLLAIIDSFQS